MDVAFSLGREVWPHASTRVPWSPAASPKPRREAELSCPQNPHPARAASRVLEAGGGGGCGRGPGGLRASMGAAAGLPGGRVPGSELRLPAEAGALALPAVTVGWRSEQSEARTW